MYAVVHGFLKQKSFICFIAIHFLQQMITTLPKEVKYWLKNTVEGNSP